MKYLANTLDTILIKYRDIEKNLLHQDKLDKDALIKLNKEYAELTPLVEKINDYQKCKKNIQDLLELQNDSDATIRNEAEKELKQGDSQLKIFETHLRDGCDSFPFLCS